MAHFDIPLNLPHAGTVARRIRTLLDHDDLEFPTLEALIELLEPYWSTGDDPAKDKAPILKVQSLSMARQVVDFIVARNAGHDRLGQCVRNLFECLEAGEEGAKQGLRAGENPDSLQRP